jgi:hypothetical protein
VYFLNIGGNVLVDFNETPLLSLDFKENTIIIDIQDTSFFDLIEIDSNTKNNKSSFWDMIHNARDFAEEVNNKKLTIILSVKGKETIIIGEKAKPSISQILSKSKHIEIKNVLETAKLSKEILD